MARWKASDVYIPNLTSKNIFIWMTRIPGSDVTGRHGKRCYSSKQRLVSSQWVLFVERRAVARWKASSEEVLIPIQIFFLHLDDAVAWRWE